MEQGPRVAGGLPRGQIAPGWAIPQRLADRGFSEGLESKYLRHVKRSRCTSPPRSPRNRSRIHPPTRSQSTRCRNGHPSCGVVERGPPRDVDP